MAVEKITINDVRTDPNKVLDFLDRTFFTDSTVYMMTEEYIKKSVIDRLVQVIFMSEGIVRLDRNPDSLSKAMLRSSLQQEDIDFILNTSLRISDIKVAVESVKDISDKDSEKAKKRIEEQKKAMSSVDNLISIIDDCLGSSRVNLSSSPEATMSVWQSIVANASANPPSNQPTTQTASQPEPPLDTLRVERPLNLNFSFIDLKKLDNNKIFELFSQLLSTDSNSSLELFVPLSCLIDDVAFFLENELTAFAETAAKHAATLNNAISFTAEPDAFESLFNSL